MGVLWERILADGSAGGASQVRGGAFYAADMTTQSSGSRGQGGIVVGSVCVVLLCVLAGWLLVRERTLRARLAGSEARLQQLEALRPSASDQMHLVQAHFADVYFLLEYQNWALMEHKLEQIDALVHRTAELVPNENGVDVRERARAFTLGPITQMRAAASAQSHEQGIDAFLALMDSCNACHAATGHTEIAITKPTLPGSRTLILHPPPEPAK